MNVSRRPVRDWGGSAHHEASPKCAMCPRSELRVPVPPQIGEAQELQAIVPEMVLQRGKNAGVQTIMNFPRRSAEGLGRLSPS